MEPGGPRREGPSRLRPFLPAEPVPVSGDEPAPGERRPSDVSPLRPYLLTGGRARSGAETLELEAQVVTTETGFLAIGTLTYEQRDILRLCQAPLAIAEVAAQLGLHLGVVRVLAGDLLLLGHLAVRRPALEPHRNRQILERVIRGLEAIE
jgi:hypothetical protein